MIVKQILIKEIARMFDLKVKGDETLIINGICGLSDNQADRLSFLSHSKWVKKASESKIPVFITKEEFEVPRKVNLFSGDPELSILQVAELFAKPQFQGIEGIHPTSVISSTAETGTGVQIGANCVIGDEVHIKRNTKILPGVVILDRVKIGEDCIIYPKVTIGASCQIGNRVILNPGVVIGGDGYGYYFHQGQHKKIPQIGIVILKDDVEIGANTSIDRARFSETVIGEGTKIDNAVHIGHNNKIGKHCLIVSSCALAGSSELEDYVTLGGQVGIADHIKIASGITVLGQSLVSKSLKKKGIYGGSPVKPAGEWNRALARLYKKM